MQDHEVGSKAEKIISIKKFCIYEQAQKLCQYTNIATFSLKVSNFAFGSHPYFFKRDHLPLRRVQLTAAEVEVITFYCM